MKYIQEQTTINMNGKNTPGSGMPSTQQLFKEEMKDYKEEVRPELFKCAKEQDLNCAWVPENKEQGGNLKLTEQDIQYRFCLDDKY